MGDTSVSPEVDEEKTVSKEQLTHDSLDSEGQEGKGASFQIHQEKETPLGEYVDSSSEKNKAGASPLLKDRHEKDSSSDEKDSDSPSYVKSESLKELESLSINGKATEAGSGRTSNADATDHELYEAEAGDQDETTKCLEGTPQEEEPEPIFDGTEIPSMESVRSSSDISVENEPGIHGYAWPEKAVAVKNFLREKSFVAVCSFLRRVSGKGNDGLDDPDGEGENNSSSLDGKEVGNRESEVHEASPKGLEQSVWNPLSLIKISREADVEYKDDLENDRKEAVEPLTMKGRVLLYTRLRCQDCKEARLFLHGKRLRYVEINVDVYPGRKLELEKLAGSSTVPKVFFNEVLIGGLSELKGLDESGKLVEKIEYVVSEAPSFEAPLPPLSGEDDLSSSGSIDELALIVRKMKDNIVVKDRFYKMRRFTNCFLGSEALDFLSEDQYLEREEAVEFGRKLASKLFFRHVLEENMFEDGSHLYRFLDDDPLISQCQNIPRGIIDVKPKPIIEISSRLRFLFYAILEAYTSEDGKHVDYRSIHGSEEFARFLRILEELQRVELQDMPREEKLSFFINLYNMMSIHAILVWGHPSGALERRKLFGEFKYVLGGCTFSLSAIYNGILRANQRPPYNLIKPFSISDKRIKMILPYPEPLVHFALVNGTRSGPSLLCFSPGDIDKELMEAAHNFIKSQGLLVDFEAKVAYASKILKWYSSDFGKNEVEVIKHASNYLNPEQSQVIMELLSSTQLKVVYLPYDWRLNH